MRNNKSKKKLVIQQLTSIILFLFFITVSFTTTINASQKQTGGELSINVEYLTYSMAFSNPSFTETRLNDYTFASVEMQGCLSLGRNPGDPAVPVKFIQLLIPAMKTVAGITVEGDAVDGTPFRIDLRETPIVPSQPPIPIGSPPSGIIKNDQIYQSSNPYPTTIYDNQYQVGYCRGFTILSFAVTPIQYTPSEGTFRYYPILTFTINLNDEEQPNEFYKGTTEDEAWVKTLVSNPEITETYKGLPPSPLEYPGGLCDPSHQYDYVIVTTTQNGLDFWQTGGSTPYNWDSLMNHHLADGLSSTLVTVQDINACPGYQNSDPLFNDSQAHIREFCKDAYEDWGTRYILFAGDSDKVPVRLLNYAYDYEETNNGVESDLYYSNLDNNFNANHNTRWGEEDDSGFDLYSELYVGRLPCDAPQDVSNWLTKSFYYADSTDLKYLNNTGFYAGDTTWNCQGDDFIDYSAIKGTNDWLGPNPHSDGPFPSWAGFQYGFETWNAVNPGVWYNLSVKWTAEPPNPGWQGGSTSAATAGLRTAINNDEVTLLSAIAHANEHMSCDVYDYQWASQYHNTKPFFITDYGCHCGDFDVDDDSMVDVMLYDSATDLAFGCVYNTGFGWGNSVGTNASSAFQQKEFWDYFFDLTNNSGDFSNWQLGKGHAWSKDRMAPTLNWDYSYGTWRGVIECCLLFGDPAQKIRPPRTNTAPYKPSPPNGPTEGEAGIEYRFTATTTDPENDSLLYQFDWGDETMSDWGTLYDSGAIANATHLWILGGTYQICVRVKDVVGAMTEWSDPMSIYIGQPVIQIAKIKGGIGVRFNLVNNGDGNATNINWNATIVGETSGITMQQQGSIPSLGVGQTTSIKPFGLFIGFGKLSITVEAVPFYGNATKQKVDAFLLGIFVLILK
ncbi:MAG TPA: C25 family cysteine peptidase [Candidatus Thermoplasmatota archaeon]|nr:C25 family cysteine peptidase [Candidatus Thermoplasmatota archaeon]